jgi:hypothetical protein
MYLLIYKVYQQSTWNAHNVLFDTREAAQTQGDRMKSKGTYAIRVIFIEIEHYER